MVGKIEEINLRAVSIFTTAQLTAVPPYYSVDTSVDTVDSTMLRISPILLELGAIVIIESAHSPNLPYSKGIGSPEASIPV